MPPRVRAGARLGLLLVCALLFEARAQVQPDIDVNFADISTNADWLLRANSDLINFSTNWDNCGSYCIKQSSYYGFFAGSAEGYMRFEIPSGYDTIEVKFRTYDDHTGFLGQDVNMYVLSDSTKTSGFSAETPVATSVARTLSSEPVAGFQNVILTKPEFQDGQYVYIVEDGGIIDPEIRIQFKNTLPAAAAAAPITVTPSASTHGGSLAFYGGTAGAREYGVATLLHSGGAENQTAYELTFSEPMTCDILLVAGGGGGGVSYESSRVQAAGGGAGGVLILKSVQVNAGTWDVRVGDGGDGDTPVCSGCTLCKHDSSNVCTSARGKNGHDTSFSALNTDDNNIARGGGGGGSRKGYEVGSNGGSGGGNVYDSDETYYSLVVGKNTGISGQGHDGAETHDGDAYDAGGGGGAGLAADDGKCNGGDGVNEYEASSSTSLQSHFHILNQNIGHNIDSVLYFGGGGSAGWGTNGCDTCTSVDCGTYSNCNNNNCIGGKGGGGSGSWDSIAQSGRQHTGGGGAGSRAHKHGFFGFDQATDTLQGGKGGSGVFIIRFQPQSGGTIDDSAPAAAAACPTTASDTVQATTTASAWDADLKAHDLAAGDTLVFSPSTPDPLDVSRGFTAVLLARPGAAGQTGDLLTLADTNAAAIAKLGADAGAVAVECPGAGAVVEPADGATLHAQTGVAAADQGLGVYALVASDTSAKVYAPAADGSFLHAGVGVSGCSGFAGVGAVADMGTNLAQECSSVCPTISGGYYGGKQVDKLFDNIAIVEDISTWTSETVLTGWAAPAGTASATFQDQFWAQVDLESAKQIHSIHIYTGYIDSSKTLWTESRLAGFRVYISDTSQTDLANFNPTTATLCYEHPDTTPNGEEIVSCVGQARYVVIQVRRPWSNLREVKIYGPAPGSATGKLASPYSLTLDELVWDFSDKNTKALWEAYAQQKNVNYNYGYIFLSTYGQSDSFFTSSTNEGTFEFTVPSGYDGVRVKYGNSGYSYSETSTDDAVELHWVRPPSTFADPLHGTGTKISEVDVGIMGDVNEITFPTETTFYDVEPGDKLKLVERLSEIYYGIVITFRKAPLKLASPYSLTLGGGTFAGLLGEAFVAPRALSRAELGLAIHGLAEYTGDAPAADAERWYTFDGDLSSYHDRAARRRAAAQAEAAAVVGGGQAGGSSPATADTNINLARACGVDEVSPCTVTGSATDGGADYQGSAAFELVNDNNVLTDDIHGNDIPCLVFSDASTSYLKIDMGKPRTVASVLIWHRDVSLCNTFPTQDTTTARQADFQVWIGDEDSDTSTSNFECYRQDGNPDSLIQTVDCEGTGQFLFIKFFKHYASVHEVLIYAPLFQDPAAAAAAATAALSSGTEVYTPAPARRLYALEVAAAQTLDAPVAGTFAWTGPWTVAAWLRAGAGASGAVLSVVDGGGASVDAVQAGNIRSSEQFCQQGECTADQVSDGYGHTADLGIDGNYCQDMATGAWGATQGCNACTHTATTPDSNPWWRVDLGSERQVTLVKVWGRSDAEQDRLNDFKITISTSDDHTTGTTCSTTGSIPATSYQKDVSCAANGRYVFVKRTGVTDIITVCEVEIWGFSAAAPAWTHVALTYPGSGTDAQLHVNGGAASATVDVSALQTAGGSVRITGAAVDDLRVFTSDLSGSLGQAGAPVKAQYIIDLETKAAQVSGVSGWSLVRYLPACAAGTVCQYTGDDDFRGTYTLNAVTKLETEEWSTGFANMDEIMLVKGSVSAFDRWVYSKLGTIKPGGYCRYAGPTDSTWETVSVLKTQSSSSATSVAIFWDSTGRETSPWIYSSSDSNDNDNIVFVEYFDATASSHVKSTSFDDAANFFIFVRNAAEALAGAPCDSVCQTWIAWTQDAARNSAISSKSWKFKGEKPAGLWFPDGFLEDTPSSKHLLFIRKKSDNTILWVVATKQQITDAGTSWSAASGVTASSTVYLFNDDPPTSCTHAPIVADTGAISNNQAFIYREEYGNIVPPWHPGTPVGWEYYVLEEI